MPVIHGHIRRMPRTQSGRAAHSRPLRCSNSEKSIGWATADSVAFCGLSLATSCGTPARESVLGVVEPGLIFCQDDGTPYKPDYVTRRFQRLATLAGLPVIKLHEGRHSAASLARNAAVDPEIRRRTLGHADAAMTSHYTHIEAEARKAAAEAAAKLVEGGVMTHECSQNVPIGAGDEAPRPGQRRPTDE
jgi:hypothetical protein